MPSMRYDTSTAIRLRSPSRSLPDVSCTPFLHRSPQQSSANAACSGLKPPSAERLRRANLHLPHSITSEKLSYIGFLSCSWHTDFRAYVAEPSHVSRTAWIYSGVGSTGRTG